MALQVRRLIWPDGLCHWERPLIDDVLRGGSLPFHPIISFGTRLRLSNESVLAHWWPVVAPLLEHVWNRHLRDRSATSDELTAALLDADARLAAYLNAGPDPSRCGPTAGDVPESVAHEFVVAMYAAGALSCAQSMAAVLSYLRSDGGQLMVKRQFGRHTGASDHSPIDARYLREGHTSSIIALNAVGDRGRGTALPGIVLNVVRDTTDARKDLLAMADQLAYWSARDASSVAAVHDFGQVLITSFGRRIPVDVIAVEHVSDGRELHVVPNDDDAGRGLLVAVDRFDHGRAGLPHVVAKDMSRTSSDRFWSNVVSIRTSVAQIDWQRGSMTAPQFELNEGDVVAAGSGEHQKVVLVGTDSSPWRGPIGAWPYEVALSSARDSRSDRGGRIFWGNPELALRALGVGLNRRCSEGESRGRLISMLEAALSIDLGQVTRAVSQADIESQPELAERVRIGIRAFLDTQSPTAA